MNLVVWKTAPPQAATAPPQAATGPPPHVMTVRVIFPEETFQLVMQTGHVRRDTGTGKSTMSRVDVLPTPKTQ